MTDRTFVEFVQYGRHSSSDPSVYDTVPGTLKFLRAVGGWPLSDGYNALAREIQQGDGATVASLQGTQQLGLAPLTVELTGLSGAGSRSGTTDTSSLSHDVDELIEAGVGAAADDAISDTTSSTDGGSGTSVIVDGGSGPLQENDIIAVAGTSSGDLVARQITSISGDPTMTIDRALTDHYGTADTADESAVVHAARRYTVTASAGNIAPLYFDGERDSFRRTYFGALGNLVMEFPSGGLATLRLDGAQCMRWAAATAANPTYSAPTTGSPIKVKKAAVWIGSTLYAAYGVSVDLGNVIAPRPADGGQEGNFGYVRTRVRPMLKMSVLVGTGTTPDEITSTQLETWRGDTTVDIGVQVGRSVGEMVYLRAPTARIMPTTSPKDDNGLQVLDLEIECVGATPLHIGFF